MDMPLSERKQIENEMIFRRTNEKVGDDLDTLDAKNSKDDYPELRREHDVLLHFKCECSDENCDARIPIQLHTYKKIHENRSMFIVKPNHQVTEIEEVVLTKKEYSVVEKHHSTAEPGDTLNNTTVDNS